MIERGRTSSLTTEHIREIGEMLAPGHMLREEPMARHTTFRIGGPAELFLAPDQEELPRVLAYAYRSGLPILPLGNGSNLLVGDYGIPGIVLSTENLLELSREGDTITVGAGVKLGKLAFFAKQEAMSGLEFASGIPGSLGGAVFMNAGAYGGEMKDVVTEVTTYSFDGKKHVYTNEDMDFSYRHSRMEGKKEIIVSAKLLLHRGDPAEIDRVQKDLNSRRVEKQPLEFASAGSTFKRPEGYFAGKLIEDAGLKGYRVGDAQVSEKHCGFCINRGSATAADMKELIHHVIVVVEEKFGVTLEPEVRILGE